MAYIPAENRVVTETQLSRVFTILSMAATSFRSSYRKIVTRTALAELSPEQLQDIGRTESNRLHITVEPRLMTKLMSMR